MAYYCLTNVKFDNSYKNACFFSNSQVREEALHPINYNEIKKEINFDFGKFIYTSINVKDYQNQNYCIIEYNNSYYYYFITDANYYAVNSWRLTLELDVITQYITGANANTFSWCNIVRAHCDRWIRTGNKVRFNVSEGSQIVNHEVRVDKITKSRQEVKLNFCTYSIVNNWLKNNVSCWLYLYIDCKHSFKLAGYQGTSVGPITPIEYTRQFLPYSYVAGTSAITNDYAVISIPVYKNNNKKICFYDNVKKSLCYVGEDGLENFYLQNNQTEFVYNIKISTIPPVNFSNIQDISNVQIINDNLCIKQQLVTENNINKGFDNITFVVDSFGNIDLTTFLGENYVKRDGCFVNVYQQYTTVYSEKVDTECNFEFDVAVIKGNRNVAFEPKVLNDCYSVTIRDSSNGEFVYNLLHLNEREVTGMYTEGLNITNNNYYYRLESNGIVPAPNMWNWDGIVNTVDYSQVVANDNIANFLANNKNFLLTKVASIGIPLIGSGITGNLAGAASSGIEAAKTLIDFDNMRNKINSLRNTNDSVILNMLVNDGIKLYVDIEKALDNEIEKYYNYVYNFGYSLNVIDNPFNYINTRKYFNYLQFDADYININAPTDVEDKIKYIFTNGVRLWNDYSSIYDYTHENYENYL